MATNKPKTVLDLEVEIGRPMSLRNVKTGKDAYRNKHIKTIEKELAAKVSDFRLPDKMPEHLHLKYADWNTYMVGERLQKAMVVLNAFGLLD